MNINQMIQMYLNDKQLAWAPSTLKTAEFHLMGYAVHISKNPNTLWKAMNALKPYSRVTVFARVCDFYQWLVENGHIEGPNPYKQFRKKNARQFKNTYQTNKPQLSYQEAFERINRIEDAPIREHARFVLQGGLRFTESRSVKDGVITGKGGKTRECFTAAPHPGTNDIEYWTFRRALKAVGLKPHDLRKLFLNECVTKGADPFQLMEIAGWSNLNTAQSYIEANRTKLKELVSKVQEGLNPDGITEK
jgi:integrase